MTASSRVDWAHQIRFPWDELGKDINRVRFYEVMRRMKAGEHIYDILGVMDSLVREHVFMMLAEVYHVDYRYIRDIWLEPTRIALNAL